MPVLSARNLAKAYGAEPLLSDVSLTLVRGERVGLLGMNGTGKSTLLRVLSGIEQPDTGIIERRRGASVLYLAQEPQLDPEQTPRMIVEEALVRWQAATRRHAEISRAIEQQGALPELLSEQAELGEQIEQLGGWSHGHVVDDMLGMLGVRERDRDRRVGTLSGGELRRVALARILVAAPSLALLDEPTNHLDVETIAWLEEYLAQNYSGAMLLVTHDRYMLDAVCQRILELDRGTLNEYQGNYGDYLEQKAERLAHEQRVEQNRLNLLRREQAWLLRGPRARTTKQKARLQRAQALVAAEPNKQQARLELEALELSVPRTSKAVLDLLDVELRVAGTTLISALTLHVLGGERIGIVGPNGIGKTSLLKAVAGELEPAAGRVVRGTQTRIALFDQARAALRDDWSILDNVAEREDAARLGAGAVILGERKLEMRNYLEQFLFDSGKQRQKVGTLSGGERARVALAKILKSGANLLLLDEPTNDLDVATLASLEELLQSWPGSALIVSHDRFFLDRVATSILAFEGDARVVRYPGNYATYLSLRPNRSAQPSEQLQPKDAAATRAAEPLAKPLTYAEKRELELIVDQIARSEERLRNIEQRLADPRIYASGPDEARKLRAELDVAKAEVSQLMARWEELETRREASSTR